jgi:hypothetical protein
VAASVPALMNKAAACERGAKRGCMSLDGLCLIPTHGLARTALVVCSTRRSEFSVLPRFVARGFALKMRALGPLSRVGRRATQGLAEGGAAFSTRLVFGL